MLDIIFQALPYIVGTGGGVSLLLAHNKNKANALEIMQRVYTKFAHDTAMEIGQMKEEIRMLNSILRKHREQCAACPNNEQNRNP